MSVPQPGRRENAQPQLRGSSRSPPRLPPAPASSFDNPAEKHLWCTLNARCSAISYPPPQFCLISWPRVHLEPEGPLFSESSGKALRRCVGKAPTVSFEQSREFLARSALARAHPNGGMGNACFVFRSLSFSCCWSDFTGLQDLLFDRVPRDFTGCVNNDWLQQQQQQQQQKAAETTTTCFDSGGCTTRQISPHPSFISPLFSFSPSSPGEQSVGLVQEYHRASPPPPADAPRRVRAPSCAKPARRPAAVFSAAPALGRGEGLPQRPAGFPLPQRQDLGPVERRQLDL